MLKQLALVLLLSGVAFAADTYDGYKIYDVNARNAFEKQVLLRLSYNEEYDFFDLPRSLDAPSRVMVQPQDQEGFEHLLDKYSLDYSVVNEDFGRSVRQEQDEQSQRLMNQRSTGRSISFKAFHRFADINAYLDELAAAYPSRVTVKVAGKSYENRDIKTITISNGDGKTGKKVIFLDAGIHAREWIAHAGALYVIHQLVENFAANSALLNGYDWVILPVVNPDGYEYTHTSTRMWRKTRKPVTSACYGTDANRNFDFHWGEVGASSSSCADTFKGETAFSEPETQLLRDQLLAHRENGKMYLTLHSYGNYLLYPWGYTSALPSSWRDIDAVAQAGAAAIKAATGTKYTVGSSTNVLYAAAGGSDDYAFGVAGFPVAITMELPAGGTGFNPTTSQIESMVSETWLGIKAMAQEVIKKY
ncbi:hypothetical protein KR009_009830 [Drosophila setifemur]|nr:hypothetical protein KR009_009830 [Drosophila setifemur]